MVVKPKQLKDVPNERYFSIVTDIVKDNHSAKLLKWISLLTEEHKRGLRLLKTIFDLKGTKKFKKREGKAESLPSDFDVANLSAADAKRIFQKLTTTTSYEKNFGARPTAQADYSILKTKKLSSLPIADVLKPEAVRYFENWISINDQAEFTGRLYFTLRDIATVIKN